MTQAAIHTSRAQVFALVAFRHIDQSPMKLEGGSKAAFFSLIDDYGSIVE
jgi:hypothetical protein